MSGRGCLPGKTKWNLFLPLFSTLYKDNVALNDEISQCWPNKKTGAVFIEYISCELWETFILRWVHMMNYYNGGQCLKQTIVI